MHTFGGNLLSVLFLIPRVLAAPTKIEENSFVVHRRAVTSPGGRNGVAALDKVFRKYGWAIPERINNKVHVPQNISIKQAEGDGIVRATPGEADTSFLSPIKVGGQTLMMNFDTGSSDLWVFNTNLSPRITRGHAVYDPKKSSIFKPMNGARWRITYGDGSGASGIVGTDVVNIGGAKVANQAIELATTVTDSFAEDVDSDGLVGLGFGSINTVKPQQQKTFFENVMPTLDKPVFTANLRHHTLGSYEFGRIDSTQFKGPLTYTKIDPSRGFWQVESTSFAVGDGVKQTNPNASPAIIDSGTTLMLADDGVVRSYWRQVEGAKMDEEGTFSFPCVADLPDFHIALGPTYMATIPGELMNYATLARNRCMGGMQSNQGQGIQIYGGVLFKSQFVVFDGANKTVGFAPHA